MILLIVQRAIVESGLVDPGPQRSTSHVQLHDPATVGRIGSPVHMTARHVWCKSEIVDGFGVPIERFDFIIPPTGATVPLGSVVLKLSHARTTRVRRVVLVRVAASDGANAVCLREGVEIEPGSVVVDVVFLVGDKGRLRQ